ncbi:hypothetical protein ASE21_14865 [Flavobacterium sp. Root901]|uniref:putative PEP-binding protein n=1 Tax=Flavobacterium sp. Root901 TaxID=1736605 RepID=UPI00070F410A|nr:putative PEP-binding protein [Flavobacterium sp. Root901]KRD09126.1 hypothetical protein ASE21_14865 [Flavobacterium sp. Root901]
MKAAAEKGRSVNKAFKIGICGEHGGEPSSIEFCHELGMDYVSFSDSYCTSCCRAISDWEKNTRLNAVELHADAKHKVLIEVEYLTFILNFGEGLL